MWGERDLLTWLMQLSSLSGSPFLSASLRADTSMRWVPPGSNASFGTSSGKRAANLVGRE